MVFTSLSKITSCRVRTRRGEWTGIEIYWPDIVKHIRNWYLEPVFQSNDRLTLEEQDRLMKDYRQTRQGTNQSLSEWEITFKRLVILVNERAYANKRGLEQARDFVDKLLGSSYGIWKHECYLEENRQQQRIACGEPRERAKGYPQTLEEAVQRAKVVDRQNHLRDQKKEEREEHGNRDLINPSRDHSYHKRKKAEPYSEFNASANRTAPEDQSKYTYSIQQLRDMPKNTSAKSLGLKECRICKRNGKCGDNIFVHCIDELKKAKGEKKGDQRNLLATNPDSTSAAAILAKVELAYKLGQADGLKNAQEANNFMRTVADYSDEIITYSRQVQYNCMNRAGPFSPERVPRSLTEVIRAILDTGSSLEQLSNMDNERSRMRGN